MQLTMNRIERLQCPPGKKDKLFFDAQKGLAVRVTEGGGKNYLCQYVFHERCRRIPLGSTDAISLADARIAARQLMGDVARGIDPFAVRQRTREEARKAADTLTLQELLENWRALHLAARRPRYAAEAVRALRVAFPSNLDLAASKLERPVIVKALDDTTRLGNPTMAARIVAYGKAAFGWAVKRGLLSHNPFAGLPMAPTTRRERVLTDDELAAIWHATDGPKPFNAIIRALVLTGQRRSEVAGMTRSELDRDLTNWTVPAARAKNGLANAIPVSRPLRDLLLGLPQDGDLVFGRYNNFARDKATLDIKSGVSGWVIHDIRRTVATGLQRLGVRLEVTERILNHVGSSRGGIVGIYQRHEFVNEKRNALEAWGTHVIDIAEGNKTDNIIAINKKSASGD
jgi:integrase